VIKAHKENQFMKADPEIPTAAANADEVRGQLKRLLEHNVFKGSRRCARLLEYLVDHRLKGEAIPPKERTLGIEVFERETDYDTSEDPIVRNVASEIRKRIAQYYIEPGHERELHINLPLGSYVPDFHVPEETTQPRNTQSARSARSHIFRYSAILAAVALVLCVAGVIGLQTPSPLDRFWSPILESHNRVLVCLLAYAPAESNGGAAAQTNAANSAAATTSGITFVSLTDNKALVNILHYLESKKAKIETQYQSLVGNSLGSSTLSGFADLSKGPAVLLGDYGWTRLRLASIRFRVVRDESAGLSWIEDVENPSVTKWKVNVKQPQEQYAEDYAIISRIFEDMTGQTLLYLTALGSYGNGAAAEFVTNASLMSQVAPESSPDWKKKNLQIVISSKIANGTWGNPQVLAKHFW
jgi:hypothetical protein